MPISDIIAPEIKDDELYNLIMKIAAELPLKNILEIGSSSGGGSTEAWVRGITQNPQKPTLHCLEVSRARYEKLRDTYAATPQVKCHWSSSLPVERFPTEAEIKHFYETENSKIRNWPLEEVLTWLREDVQYLKESGAPGNGIADIRKTENIYAFDAVLIDGSEFLGCAEFAEVYGASLILLDDIMTYKCFYPFKWLNEDPKYNLAGFNQDLRNGYAIFQKVQ